MKNCCGQNASLAWEPAHPKIAGPCGYANLKGIMEDPKDPEHREMKEWLGLSKNKKWDAEAFDLDKTNSLVAKI